MMKKYWRTRPEFLWALITTIIGIIGISYFWKIGLPYKLENPSIDYSDVICGIFSIICVIVIGFNYKIRR